MRSYLSALFLVLCASSAFAISTQNLDFAQSSPQLNWSTIENDSVRVIYPDQIKGESVYIANLVEYYSQFVGKTYGIDHPQKFNLVIRPEMAQPNGYVTLAPRRSEWFSASMYFPFVGTTEWYQTLSIHEYRHVNQFDHFNQGTVRILYYLTGDFGVMLATAFALPSWYMEGDAVWAETKFTDGGRGRSPRFLSRLKALVLSDKIPTYDQFLSGSYQTDLPNQYVYGYVLVSHATHKFGDDVWEKVTSNAAQLPHPLRFYISFEQVTGQDFEDFYNETFQDLKQKWSQDAMPVAKVDFRDVSAPYKTENALYFIKQTMDTRAQVIKEQSGVQTVVTEIPYNREIYGVSFSSSHLAMTEYLPNARYAHKGSSDLVIYDLASGQKTKITEGRRLYNPNFNHRGTKILTTDFRPDQSWAISEFDLNGKELNSFSLKDGKVAEARYLDDQNAVVLFNNRNGLKSLLVVDLVSKQVVKTLLAPSRNLITAVSVDKNKNVFFEAQYKGYNEIFKMTDSSLSQCTKSKISAYTPSSDGENLYYSQVDPYGSTVATDKISACVKMDVAELGNYKYLGQTASDAYNNFPTRPIVDQESFFTKNSDKYKAQDYNDFELQGLVPHTWGLTLARGSGLGFGIDNYLRTVGFSGYVGTDAEEKASFVELNFDYKKFYPIFRLQLENRQRKVVDYANVNKYQWTEQAAGLAVIIPYTYTRGLFGFMADLSLQGSSLTTSDYEVNEVAVNGLEENLYKTQSALSLVWSQAPTPRSIQSPWLLSYSISYDAVGKASEGLSDSHRILQKAKLNTPFIFAHDGWDFSFDEQKQESGGLGYKFLPDSNQIDYVFSRGYSYRDVPFYQKASANYFFPIAYPDVNLRGFVYINRIHGNLFYDTTYVKDVTLSETLNSYGAEALFDAKILRFLPVTFGVRVLQKLVDHKVESEAFMATKISF